MYNITSYVSHTFTRLRIPYRGFSLLYLFRLFHRYFFFLILMCLLVCFFICFVFSQLSRTRAAFVSPTRLSFPFSPESSIMLAFLFFLTHLQCYTCELFATVIFLYNFLFVPFCLYFYSNAQGYNRFIAFSPSPRHTSIKLR